MVRTRPFHPVTTTGIAAVALAVLSVGLAVDAHSQPPSDEVPWGWSREAPDSSLGRAHGQAMPDVRRGDLTVGYLGLPLDGDRLVADLEHTPFLMEGRELGIRVGTVSPPTYSWQICLTGPDGSRTVIARPDDLRGHVMIDSAEVALQYARLWTSPATLAAVSRPRVRWLEIVPEHVVDEAFLFGAVDPLSTRSADEGRMAGDAGRPHCVLAETEWRDIGLSDPLVTEVDGGYEVMRYMARFRFEEFNESQSYPGDYYKILRVREFIAINGGMDRAVLHTIELPPWAHIKLLPWSESP